MSFKSCKTTTIGSHGVATMARVDFFIYLKMVLKMSLFSPKATMWWLVARQEVINAPRGKNIEYISWMIQFVDKNWNAKLLNWILTCGCGAIENQIAFDGRHFEEDLKES